MFSSLYYLYFEQLVFVQLSVYLGELIHSHDYRSAEPLAGKSVVLLGAGLSGLDIAMELSNVNAKVFYTAYIVHLFIMIDF